MNSIRHIWKSASSALVLFFLPLVASAAPCPGTSDSYVKNPLQYCGIMEFVENALRLFVMLALPVLAFFIVLAGFSFILARGNSTKLEKAKMNFLYVIIGTCLVLGAWLLASLIGATVTQITG